MAEIIIHKADTRGTADRGWLKAGHSFSFGNYYNPDKMGYGVLRVLNDDFIQPSMGFGTHPHENMEIITILLDGALRHKDTLGHEFIIEKGEVQVISAGQGIGHSEYNNSSTDVTNLLQIWILPKKENLPPQYDQKRFALEERVDDFQLLVSPDGRNNSLSIGQDAFISQINMGKTSSAIYDLVNKENGVFIFVIEGGVIVEGLQVEKRDAMMVHGESSLRLEARVNSDILVIEVPLEEK